MVALGAVACSGNASFDPQSVADADSQITRVEPLSWWTGMKTPLQLLINGQNISQYNVSLEGENGVDITAVHKADSPNYLFVDVAVDSDAKAGTYYLVFSKGDEQFKYPYTIELRAIGLSQKAVGYVKLVDNTVYYQHEEKETGVTLHQIGTDKKGDEMLIDKNIPPLATYQNKIYYSGFEKDHNLYAIDLATGASGMVLQANMCYPTVEAGYVYYMDMDANYRLCRVDLLNLDAGATVLTNDRVDTYNVYGNCIFYQKNSETNPALIRMNTDGSNPEVVAEGNYTNINCTSNYTYFYLFGQDAPVYKTPTNGVIQVTTFDAARDAALENQEN